MTLVEIIQRSKEACVDTERSKTDGETETCVESVVSPFEAPWPPRPEELATWPDGWRERWGELANNLEAQGVAFPESERRAFAQIKVEMKSVADVTSGVNVHE